MSDDTIRKPVALTVHIDEVRVAPRDDEEPFKMAEAHAVDGVFVSTSAVVAVMPSRRFVVVECAGVDCAFCKARRPVAALAWVHDPFGYSPPVTTDLARDLIREAVEHLVGQRTRSREDVSK